MGSTTLPRVPPTRQPVQRNEARFLLSRRAGRSFPSDLAYHPNSAVPGRFVSKRQGRFLSMASGPPRRLPRNRTNLRAAVAQHFVGIARGLAVPRIVVLGQAPNDVPEFVEQRGDLRGGAVPPKGCYPQHLHAAWLQRPFPAVLRQHFGGLLEKRAVRVQTNRGIAAGVLPGTGDRGMLENLSLPDFLFGTLTTAFCRRVLASPPTRCRLTNG